MLEIEQKYNEIRKPVYDKRNDIINAIPDFWLTAVSSYFICLRDYVKTLVNWIMKLLILMLEMPYLL